MDTDTNFDQDIDSLPFLDKVVTLTPLHTSFGENAVDRDFLFLANQTPMTSPFDAETQNQILASLVDSTTAHVKHTADSPPSSDNSLEDFEFDNSDNLPKKRGRKKRTLELSPEEQLEKISRRKQQTQVASKLYRQRKKAMEETLMERLQKLEEEKKLLKLEMEASKNIITQLRQENNVLKKQKVAEGAEIVAKRLEVMRKLEKQLAEGVSDEELLVTLKEGRKLCIRCVGLGRSELMDLINPEVMQNLVANGFFNTDLFFVEHPKRKGGVSDVISRIRSEITDLTEEQIAKMLRAEEEHYQRLEILQHEREKIGEELAKFFTGNRLKSKPTPALNPNAELPLDLSQAGKLDLLELVSAATLLEHLRQSLKNEEDEWNNTLDIILDQTMSPRQIAHFYLHCEFQHASVQQLSHFWAALNKEWASGKRAWK